MSDAKEALSKATGLDKTVVEKIWGEVKVNHELLRGCAGPHKFVETAGAKLRGKYRCASCGGTVDTVAFRWYTDGLKHGRKRG